MAEKDEDVFGSAIGSTNMTSITDRIERQLGIPNLASLLAERLEPSDLQSLLLDVYRRLVTRRQTPSILHDYEANRFVRPAALRPSALLEWERLALSLLPAECEALELSPVCPLGASTVMAGLGQDRVLSTIRNTEVVSDSTNVLALEAALRRKELKRVAVRAATPVHLAASHRLLRTQHYNDPKLSSHFRVFSWCSAGRDTGSFGFEADAIVLQIEFYLRSIRAFLGATTPLGVSLTVMSPGSVLNAVTDKMLERFRENFPGVDVGLDPNRTAAREYYRTLCFGIVSDEKHLVDGGCVDWTQRLLSDAKERLVVSGIGSDRVCGMHSG